jgi:hypothetical protein
LPLALLDVSVPLSQKVTEPLGVIVGVGGKAATVTFADFESLQPEAVVTVTFKVKVPAAPAVYVTFGVPIPPVIDPPAIDQL